VAGKRQIGFAANAARMLGWHKQLRLRRNHCAAQHILEGGHKKPISKRMLNRCVGEFMFQ
jgi:hypothetical protein